MKMLRAAIASLMERPECFQLVQRAVPLTARRYQGILHEKVAASRDARLLDLGCGVGAYHDFFGCEYFGIDDNPRYIAKATRRRPQGRFFVMNAANLDFPEATFDHAVTIATTHHLDDSCVLGMVSEALRVLKPGGRLHIVDAILPLDPCRRIKRLIFAYDRGTSQRTFGRLLALVAGRFRIGHAFAQTGFPHDVCYMAVSKDQQR